jgi:hypothetical protein
MKLGIVVGMIVASLSGVAHGQLVWEKKEIEVHARPSQPEAVVEFGYTNKGNKPVTITAIKPTCSCSSAEADKQTVKPGESGKVIAKFEFGSRTGSERKTFKVSTDDPASDIELVMLVEIPETVKLAPQFVYWTPSDTGTAKPVELTVMTSDSVHITSVKSTNPKVTSEVKTLEQGKKYQVLLSVPAGSAPPLESVVTIETDYPQGSPRSYQVFARVMSARAARTLTPSQPQGK